MPRFGRFAAHTGGLALAAALLLPSQATSQTGDDVLFTTTAVSPNVLLLLDSSASMNHLIWHPAFDPDAPVSCNSAAYGTYTEGVDSDGAFDPTKTYYAISNKFYYIDAGGSLNQDGGPTRTHCGNTRTIPTDQNASPDPTLDPNTKYTHVSGAYLNWLFSDESDPYWGAGAPAGLRIDSSTNGIPTSCVGGASFGKYQRTRMNVTKQVLKDIVCQVNLVGEVRFGIAQFRNRANNTTDTNGGYVIEEVQVPNSNQQADLVSAINSVDADTDAPLAEAVFQLYTYYMSRDSADLPLGKDGVTKFPRYEYTTSSSGTGGNHSGQSNQWTADPVQYSCQKNFIMIITDGDSTKDHFAVVNDVPEAAGFADFANLIGDHNPDGETEYLQNEVYANSHSSRYLDDIALYMTEKDFRPDFDGDQTIDTYTIGFHASDAANGLLAKTALVGNGLFFAVNDEEALAQAIIDQLQNIIEKAQSFTAATVPASRTQDGEQLYVSLFTPTSKSAYWDGHLRSYRLDGAGRILDANGLCAIDDPSGDCFSGAFLPVDQRPPYWDAATSMPAPASRKLFASVLRGASLDPDVVEFVHEAPAGGVPPANAVAAADLGVTFPPASTPLGSIATNEEEYTAEIVASVRGCSFGTGANGVACTLREGQLADIFHSNPVVVGQPVLFESDPSYKTGFKSLVGSRDRVIYAGNNGGFVSGYHAGTWDATEKEYDAGTGVAPEHPAQALRQGQPRLLLRGRLADRGRRLVLHGLAGGHEGRLGLGVAHGAHHGLAAGRRDLRRTRRERPRGVREPGGRRLPLLPVGVPARRRDRPRPGLRGRHLRRSDRDEDPRDGRQCDHGALGRDRDRRPLAEERPERSRLLRPPCARRPRHRGDRREDGRGARRARLRPDGELPRRRVRPGGARAQHVLRDRVDPGRLRRGRRRLRGRALRGRPRRQPVEVGDEGAAQALRCDHRLGPGCRLALPQGLRGPGLRRRQQRLLQEHLLPGRGHAQERQDLAGLRDGRTSRPALHGRPGHGRGQQPLLRGGGDGPLGRRRRSAEPAAAAG
jgi:hypothetical protein